MAVSLAVELAELGEEHRADGDVHAHPEGVGARHHLEQALLRQLLHEQAIPREKPGVVQPHAVAQEALQVLAERGLEAHRHERLAQRLLLVLGREVRAHEVLGLLRRGALGEVDEVDRGPPRLHQVLDGLVQRRLPVLELQRDRAVARAHLCHRAPGDRAEALADGRHVPERRGHEQEARLLEEEEGHLPGHPALPVGVVVELVHHHRVDPRARLPKGQVHEDLGRAADDGCVSVHGGVAGHHADVFRTEDAAEVEELLVDERLDGAGVVGALAPGHRLEVEEGGDERLARPGGRRENDVLTLEKGQHRLLLGRVEREPGAGNPADEAVQDLLVRERRSPRGREKRR